MADLILLKDFLATQIELWKAVEGFPGYEVSNLGRVRSFRHRGDPQTRLSKVPYIRKPTPQRQGYMRFNCKQNGRCVTGAIARLVAKAFIPNPHGYPEVNHITALKSDDRAPNLEWVTKSENLQHAYKNGLKHVPHGVDCPRAKTTSSTRVYIVSLRRGGMTFSAIGQLFGLHEETIRLIYRTECAAFGLDCNDIRKWRLSDNERRERARQACRRYEERNRTLRNARSRKRKRDRR